MSLLVVGSIAFDSIKTPVGEARDVLGGSAVYFSLAARCLGPVRIVGVVGTDFPSDQIALLKSRGIDTAGIEVAQGRTFRWSGEYFEGMNRRETLSVELNVFESFQPKVPESFRDSGFVFLANGSPVTQLSVLDQVRRPRFVMADTMDLWINHQKEGLLALLKRIDGLVINDDEAILLTGERGIIAAGKAILRLGPALVVVKKGEHGAILFTSEGASPLPAYPVDGLKDPTGAGDSFAGGLMGRLASVGRTDPEAFRTALAVGTVTASFTVEDFGVRRLLDLRKEEIDGRLRSYANMLRIDAE